MYIYIYMYIFVYGGVCEVKLNKAVCALLLSKVCECVKILWEYVCMYINKYIYIDLYITIYIYTYLYMEEYELMMTHGYTLRCKSYKCLYSFAILHDYTRAHVYHAKLLRVNFTKMILIQGHIHGGNDDACRHRIRIVMHSVYTYVYTYVCTNIEKYVHTYVFTHTSESVRMYVHTWKVYDYHVRHLLIGERLGLTGVTKKAMRTSVFIAYVFFCITYRCMYIHTILRIDVCTYIHRIVCTYIHTTLKRILLSCMTFYMHTS